MVKRNIKKNQRGGVHGLSGSETQEMGEYTYDNVETPNNRKIRKIRNFLSKKINRSSNVPNNRYKNNNGKPINVSGTEDYLEPFLNSLKKYIKPVWFKKLRNLPYLRFRSKRSYNHESYRTDAKTILNEYLKNA